MRITNAQIVAMLSQLEPLLELRDIIGYAAARNTRVLKEACVEFVAFRDQAIRELGEKEIDDEGRETGCFFIKPDSEGFEEFDSRMSKIAGVEHDVDIFTLPVSEAIGVLSGSELLALDWMFEEGDL